MTKPRWVNVASSLSTALLTVGIVFGLGGPAWAAVALGWMTYLQVLWAGYLR